MCIYTFIQYIKTKFTLLILLLTHTPGRTFSDLQALLFLKMKYLLSQKHSQSGNHCKVVVEVVGSGGQTNEKEDYVQCVGASIQF